MPVNLQLLLERSTITIDKIGISEMPKKGVYVFFEGNKAIYVGRSNRLKKRLKEHSSDSSDQYSATLAFRIAKSRTSNLTAGGKKRTNAQLMKDKGFIRKFEAAKRRISKTKIRFISIDDQVEQAIFEIYAHLEFGTKLNDFRTH